MELAEEEGDDYSDRIAIRSLTYQKRKSNIASATPRFIGFLNISKNWNNQKTKQP